MMRPPWWNIRPTKLRWRRASTAELSTFGGDSLYQLGLTLFVLGKLEKAFRVDMTLSSLSKTGNQDVIGDAWKRGSRSFSSSV
ncbi:hypothetical protein ISN45_Aa03g028750 [Arabidopsis thaliana x Arabidopsis arenosa]|uniref:Uncharacterized protein n=1 Tax=Arabidopsis thaliana x Arabidopsis arenosa TaxID=1240361 RepID=A0A8T2AZH8_9BRAS|nr:hypothetical protein ISN45_Aa03g028750 [Arabidopsis thaliana x Arabidopsis arenosa]